MKLAVQGKGKDAGAGNGTWLVVRLARVEEAEEKLKLTAVAV